MRYLLAAWFSLFKFACVLASYDMPASSHQGSKIDAHNIDQVVQLGYGPIEPIVISVRSKKPGIIPW